MSGPLPGIDLHHEVRGDGPPLLLVAGATGDAEHFARLADLLAADHTVVTYDRRGNGRSPAGGDPAAAAAIPAQADDAAALIRALGAGPALVAGFSSGALIVLELLVRYEDLVRGAIVHEPALLALSPELLDRMRPVIELASRDPAAAVETFFRVNTSDAAWEAIDPETRERMVGSAACLFFHEFPAVAGYLPDTGRLAAVTTPVQALVSEHGVAHAPRIQEWVLAHVTATKGAVSGNHAPYLDQPEVLAAELRPILRQLAGG